MLMTLSSASSTRRTPGASGTICASGSRSSRRIFSGSSSHRSYPSGAWSDTISGRNVDREVAAMNQPETGEAPEAAHSRSDLQKELAEVHRQRAAISAVLRAIANSPHDLQPIFDTIIDSAVHLCRVEWGAFRLSEETGFRLVASKVSRGSWSPPMLQEHGSFVGRLLGSKSPVHIPDLATHLERMGAVEEGDRDAISHGVRTV